jgi:predicted nucleotidyltransferase
VSKVQEIIKRKNERKKKLENALESIKRQLINLGAKKIILFGSLNKEDIDIYSDLDLFVIMPSIKTGREWLNLIYSNLERKIASDIIVYNEKEFEKNLDDNSFLLEIIDTGKIIYEAKS